MEIAYGREATKIEEIGFPIRIGFAFTFSLSGKM